MKTKIKTGNSKHLNLKIFVENLANCNGFDEDAKCTLFNTDFEVGFWNFKDAIQYYKHNRKQLKADWNSAFKGDHNEKS